MLFLTAEQIKRAELYAVDFGIPLIKLMENAGTAAARIIRSRFDIKKMRVLVVCGKGNNGGDGFVCARKLFEEAKSLSIILSDGKPKSPNASEMFDRARSLGIPLWDYNANRTEARSAIESADLIVDAIFGIGFHGRTEGENLSLIDQINKSGAVKVALDIPSGINADKGIAGGTCVSADYTVALGFSKPAYILPESAKFCGKIEPVSIGIPAAAENLFPNAPASIEPGGFAPYFTRRSGDLNKGDFGRALLVCGAYGMAGAAILAAKACLRSGVGLCDIFAAKDIYGILAGAVHESVFGVYDPGDSRAADTQLTLAGRLKKATACLVGCGLGNSRLSGSLTDFIVRNAPCPVIIDADGINYVAKHIDVLKTAKAPIIMTPHPLEMGRLSGLGAKEINADRINIAADFAQKWGVYLVLKGANTVVAAPDGRTLVNMTGNAGMAAGGSGDVLAGMLASLVAQGIPVKTAAAAAVWFHGTAGDKAAEKLSSRSLTPSDLIETLPSLFLNFEKE